MKLWASILLMLFVNGYAMAQNNAGSSSSPVSVTLSSQLPSPLTPGSMGNLVVKVKNVLTPRQPITLTATATYEYNGQTQTATSNTLSLQVVQPVRVTQVNIPFPVGIVHNGNLTMPVTLNVTLLEGEEHSVSVPVRLR
jgi:hypothetical protein